MAITKHQLSVRWPSVGKGNAKRSGNSRGRRLLNLKSIELPNKKSSHVRRDDSTDFDCVIAQAAFVKSGICAAVYPSLIVPLPRSTSSARERACCPQIRLCFKAARATPCGRGATCKPREVW